MIRPIDVSLALLPTPTDRSPVPLPGGASLLVKRDDLTGLGLGGNKARKLEPLCAEALAAGADVLVTVGGGQSNHCRMTAAAGARLGLDVHLVLGGDPPPALSGNQLLMDLFGATLHFAGTHDWGDLTATSEALLGELRATGRTPALIPIGGSTPVGASAFAAAYAELLDQLTAPVAAVVHTSSSGGTHAGLLAGQALARASGRPAPPVLAIAVAKDVALSVEYLAALADQTLAHLGSPVRVDPADVEVDGRWVGPGYEVPTSEGDEAIWWAARHGGWVLDRTYSGKGFAGLLGHARDGRWGEGDTVVFWHSGGTPALFTPAGAPGEKRRPDGQHHEGEGPSGG
ncbi:MAG: 1-aminocyclopropane-1-carboxylate deaminase/D-cysteine desulfhydrase [Acidimicrobiia bacterium]